jgi:hypothetical protein
VEVESLGFALRYYKAPIPKLPVTKSAAKLDIFLRFGGSN